MNLKLIISLFLFIAFKTCCLERVFAIELKSRTSIDTIYPANEKAFHKIRFEVLPASKSFLQINSVSKKV